MAATLSLSPIRQGQAGLFREFGCCKVIASFYIVYHRRLESRFPDLARRSVDRANWTLFLRVAPRRSATFPRLLGPPLKQRHVKTYAVQAD